MTTKKKVLIIRDSEWHRNQTDESNFLYSGVLYSGVLLNPTTARMCCMGIQLAQCGVSKENLLDKRSGRAPLTYGEPQEVPPEVAKQAIKGGYPWLAIIEDEDDDLTELTTLKEKYRTLANQAMEVNDSAILNDDHKIEKLKEIFAEVGWEIDWRPDE